MARLGKPLPAGWGVDGAGEATSDAATVGEVGGLTPLGGLEATAGYKGYGLGMHVGENLSPNPNPSSNPNPKPQPQPQPQLQPQPSPDPGMLVEILCSVLSGARVGLDVQPWTVPRETGPNDFGHCFVVLDPARLGGGPGGEPGGGPDFEDRVSAYLATLRALPGSVQVPGDPEKAHEAEAAARGVALHPNVAASVKALALKWNVALPESFNGVATAAPKNIFVGARK